MPALTWCVSPVRRPSGEEREGSCGSTPPPPSSCSRWRCSWPSRTPAPDSPADIFTINDGFVSNTYSHLGNPALGVLVAETWGETGWSDNRLSHVTFDMPVGYFNLDAHCFAAPPPPTTTVTTIPPTTATTAAAGG